MDRRAHVVRQAIDWHPLGLVLLLGAVAATRWQGYLLFHSLAEMLWIVVALTTFAVAWNTRRNLDNPFLLTVGISLAPLAVIRMLHTLAFKGMGVFTGYGANLPTQLWIADRGLEVSVVLMAALLGRRRLAPAAILGGTTGLAAVLVAAIFLGIFPDCYVDGVGLTPFKVATEYAIIAAYLVAILRLRRVRDMFPPRLYNLVQAAMALGMAEEAAFTLYVDVYGVFNMLGHVIQGGYAALIYLGVVRYGLAAPQEALYHRLNQLNARLAEEALRNNERAALAVEAVDGAAWEWDMRTPRPVLSPRHRQWLGGADTEEWRGHVLAGDRDWYDDALQPRGPDHGRTAEYRLRRADGSIAWFTTSTRVFAEPSGATMVGLDQDITARKAVEAERAALADDIRRFTEVLAHHLQEPARLQSSYAQLLRRRLPLPLAPEVADALDVVQAGAEHLRRLLRDAHLYLVLDRLPPPEQPVAAGEALAHAWAGLKGNEPWTGATLEAGALPSVWMAPSRLEELFTILLANALEYRHPERPPVVAVSAGEEGGEVVLHVADNGIGIEPRYFQQIFNPFERLHTQTQHPGTGIGLALARRIVEAACGRIWVTSTPGEGTTFHFALPKEPRP